MADLPLPSGCVRRDDFFAILAEDGWSSARITGSHFIFEKPGALSFPVSAHGGGKIRREVVRAVLRTIARNEQQLAEMLSRSARHEDDARGDARVDAENAGHAGAKKTRPDVVTQRMIEHAEKSCLTTEEGGDRARLAKSQLEEAEKQKLLRREEFWKEHERAICLLAEGRFQEARGTVSTFFQRVGEDLKPEGDGEDVVLAGGLLVAVSYAEEAKECVRRGNVSDAEELLFLAFGEARRLAELQEQQARRMQPGATEGGDFAGEARSLAGELAAFCLRSYAADVSAMWDFIGCENQPTDAVRASHNREHDLRSLDREAELRRATSFLLKLVEKKFLEISQLKELLECVRVRGTLSSKYVRIQGLTGSPELNGRIVYKEEWMPDKGRWIVSLCRRGDWGYFTIGRLITKFPASIIEFRTVDPGERLSSDPWWAQIMSNL